MSIKVWTTLKYPLNDNVAISDKPVAGFDMDWTLIRPRTSVFPVLETDYDFLPYRLERLSLCIEEGYQIVVFTNQKYKGKKRATMEKRCENVFKDIVASLPDKSAITLIASFDDDIYRKPSTGMWTALNLDNLSEENRFLSFYCGDADGSPKSFGDTDRQFASNINVKFYSVYDTVVFPTL